MTSCQDYSRSVLRVSVAQICQNLGWNATQTSPLELLTDVLERYLEEIGKVSHRYSEQFGRTQPNLDDLGLTFRHMGVNLGELGDYVRHVEPVPFAHEVVAFPAPKTNNLQFPKPNSREILHHREEHIHEHLPHMFSGMEDEVVEETKASPTLTSQSSVQEHSQVDGTTHVGGEKRPLPPADGPPPGKRPRVNPSSLPEEAGHSQYEMTSITMTSSGFLTPTRGKGRLPDSRTPPPAVRHALTFSDATSGANKVVDGSDANKENTVVEPLPKEPLSCIGLSATKEGSTHISDSSSKPESAKTKVKKKEKVLLKDKLKKIKKPETKKLVKKVKGIGDSQATSVSAQTNTAPIKKVKVKPCKPKDSKLKENKSAKSDRPKEKSDSKKKTFVSPTPASSVLNENGTDSRLKDLLLSQDRYKLNDATEAGPSVPLSPKREPNLDPVPSPDSDLTLRQAFPPTDIFESSSHETSPQRLIIAEAEGRAQEKEEEKRIRLKNIDDTISAVVRESAADADKKVKDEQILVTDSLLPLTTTAETLSPRKRGRPRKVKPKDKIKSSEFIAEDMKQEKEDDMGARNEQSINDTINTVIMQGCEDSESTTPDNITTASSFQPTPPAGKRPQKEGKKKKVDKIKTPTVKKKLKDKLQNKSSKGDELPPLLPFSEIKSSISDKFTDSKMNVFEFPDTDSPPSLPVRRPSQAEKEHSPPHIPATPLSTQGSVSPVEIKPIIKSPTPETAVAASSASTSSTPSLDQPHILPLKIGLPKEKDRQRERSKDREHRKEKKEKRRDKEKKKKNKDKDREKDRDRHDKHHHEHKHEKNRIKEETTTTEGSGFKIKIKIGSKPGNSPSLMTVTENRTTSDIKKETASPSQRPEIPKLVIRRDASEGKSMQKKHTSEVSKPIPVVKIEPRNTPPTLHPASPLPGTPPPPILSRNNSPDGVRSPSPHSPFDIKFGNVRGRSPVFKSSPRHEVFTFTSPLHSPPRGRHTITPPPRTPSPSRPKSPSPTPKTPSPRRHSFSGSPMSLSSPVHRSPSLCRKSPTPTPKTPSLSPAYPPPSPVHSDHSPVREQFPDSMKATKPLDLAKPLFKERPHNPVKPLFGTPEQTDSSLISDITLEDVKLTTKTVPSSPTANPKPKGKVGRPRSKSPRANSPKGKSSKIPKSPKQLNKTAYLSKAITGKSPGRGRPPKAKTLALRAALAAAAAGEGEDVSPVKPKPKPPPIPLEIPKELSPASPLAVEMEKSEQDTSSESPSPTNLSLAFSTGPHSRQRGTVEAETVGSFIDASTGQLVWICPACKIQDDGSPMIGCDKCDDWYHWVCVNITKEPPEEESWFCPRCSAREKQIKPKGKRGRKKKIH